MASKVDAYRMGELVEILTDEYRRAGQIVRKSTRPGHGWKYIINIDGVDEGPFHHDDVMPIVDEYEVEYWAARPFGSD